MENYLDSQWHQIKYESQQKSTPCERWGHKTILIQDQIILFGGFSNVTYLSDLWSYNIHTNKWEQVITFGKKPQGKSNFTMHFDKITNQLIIFGGGGPNKKRFNKISILNWNTKFWTEFVGEGKFKKYLDSQNSPWQRTYHSSEFKYPFLITFGGEGVGSIDFDDLWAFNIVTKQWKQIKVTSPVVSISSKSINNKQMQNLTENLSVPQSASLSNSNNQKYKIQARRFHSTTLINYQFFVLSGCRINYQCISNISSINLKAFYDQNIKQTNLQQINNNRKNSIHLSQENYNNTQSEIFQQNKQSTEKYNLFWKEYQLASQANLFIERWGHSSQVYQNKIYIFGGRNKDDYNDLLEFDPETVTLKKILSITEKQSSINLRKTSSLPKCRRRHSSCMIGSSMIIFGGFNIQYFNDMQYISLLECRQFSKYQSIKKKIEENQIEIIELEDKMYSHFLEEIKKEKSEYDLDIMIKFRGDKDYHLIRSISSLITNNSLYFKNLLKYTICSNPERKAIFIQIQEQISFETFNIFNSFMMKKILVLPKIPKHHQLKYLSQLLICSNYFIVPGLENLIQNYLSLIVVGYFKQNNLNGAITLWKILVDDIFNLAATYNLLNLLEICAEKKIVHRQYLNTNSKYIGLLRSRQMRLKRKYLEKMAYQIQFDDIQKGKLRRQRQKGYFGMQKKYNKNIKQINLIKQQQQLKQLQNINLQTRSNIIPGRSKLPERKKSIVSSWIQAISSRFYGKQNEITDQPSSYRVPSRSEDIIDNLFLQSTNRTKQN